jgi:dGTPase
MSRPGGKIVRHPISFLTEAADDICYRILDLEDAVEMKILTEREVHDVFLQIIDKPGTAGENLEQLRAKAINTLVEAMWAVFINDYNGIMHGSRDEDLKAGLTDGPAAGMTAVKSLYQRIFAERTKIAAELGAYKAIGRILGALCHAIHELAAQGSYENTGFVDRRCLDLAWGATYVRTHEKKPTVWWLHQVLDFTAGLTDNYARQLSREIEGT